MIYGYARVSTKGQEGNTSLSYQTFVIKERAKTYTGEQFPEENMVTEVISGTIAPIDRPKFKEMIYNKIKKGDYLIVAHTDRLGRDPGEVLKTVNLLAEKGVHIDALDMMGADITKLEEDDNASLLFDIKNVIAKNEKKNIARRMNSGREKALEEAEKRGVRLLGRPNIYSQADIDRALYLINELGYSYKQAAVETNISKSTIGREMQKYRRAEELKAQGKTLPESRQRDRYFKTIQMAEMEEARKLEEAKKHDEDSATAPAPNLIQQIINLSPEEKALIRDLLK